MKKMLFFVYPANKWTKLGNSTYIAVAQSWLLWDHTHGLYSSLANSNANDTNEFSSATYSHDQRHVPALQTALLNRYW